MDYKEIVADILQRLIETNHSLKISDIETDYGLTSEEADRLLKTLIDDGTVRDVSTFTQTEVLWDMRTTASYLAGLLA